jgi:hypothetical protein
MVICLDTVGRKSVTVGRADDNGCSVEGRVYLLHSITPLQGPSLQTNKNETNTVLPTGNLGKTHTSRPFSPNS